MVFESNPEEDEIHLLYRKDLFEIWGTTRTIDKNDYYVTVYLNGAMNNGYLNENPVIARISLLSPEYIQYDKKLNINELNIFNNFMHNNWNDVINMLKWNYEIFNENIELNIQCPDYSKLETAD